MRFLFFVEKFKIGKLESVVILLCFVDKTSDKMSDKMHEGVTENPIVRELFPKK